MRVSFLLTTIRDLSQISYRLPRETFRQWQGPHQPCKFSQQRRWFDRLFLCMIPYGHYQIGPLL